MASSLGDVVTLVILAGCSHALLASLGAFPKTKTMLNEHILMTNGFQIPYLALSSSLE
jgi:hypothetical protein